MCTSGGVLFNVHLSSFIEWQIFCFGGYEAERIAAFKACINKVGVLLDVGANIGNHGLCLSPHFTEVHCFEPNPDVFTRLRRNLDLNSAANVVAVNAGAGDSEAILRFYQPLGNNQGTGTFVEAEATPPFSIVQLPVIVLDDYVERVLAHKTVAAIKVDVQGFEASVLRGLTRTLAAHRPLVWIEVSDHTRKAIAMLNICPRRVQRFSVYRQLGIWNTERLENSSMAELLRRNGDYLLQF